MLVLSVNVPQSIISHISRWYSVNTATPRRNENLNNNICTILFFLTLDILIFCVKRKVIVMTALLYWIHETFMMSDGRQRNWFWSFTMFHDRSDTERKNWHFQTFCSKTYKLNLTVAISWKLLTVVNFLSALRLKNNNKISHYWVMNLSQRGEVDIIRNKK